VIVLYRCSCLTEDAQVEVPERVPALGVGPWVEQVVAARIGQDHARRSPACRETTMSYVKIPIDGDRPGVEGERAP
jgi:hypothetical protein